MKSKTITINATEYTVSWSLSALLRYQRLEKAKTGVEDILNLLFAMLPKDAFEQPEALADVMTPDELLSLSDTINGLTTSDDGDTAKKKPKK